ncbi:MAG: tyrosine-type recombinase/integrase [Bacteroidales bacterium]
MAKLNTDEYIHYLSNERRYSKHTLVAYQNDLDDYQQYIREYYGDLPAAEHQHAHIRSWLSDLLARGLQARTVSRKISALKSFFKYSLEQGYITTNPTLKLSPIKIPHRIPVFIQENDMQKLFTEPEFEDNYKGIRDYTILQILYGSGIRVSELIHLSINNIDLAATNLKVRGKRNKERIIPFSFQLKQVLIVYLEQRKAFLAEKGIQDEGWLFLSTHGKKTYPKLIYETVRYYLEQVTTTEKKSPHVLRHTYATHLLSHGADLNAIKELLGHSSLSATEVYTHSTIEQLKEIYEQAHPRGK